MSEKKLEGAYSLNDVEKCINNAFRLYKDALNTSTPTKAALIEIGIEELAKGFILLANIPKPSFDLPLNGLPDSTFEDIPSDLLFSLKNYDFKKFNTYDHKTKLQVVDTMFKYVIFLNTYMEKKLPIIRDLLSPAFGQLGNIEKSDINYMVSYITKLNLKGLNKIKEKGFYVDFKDNKAISPEEQDLKTENFVMVFFMLYTSLIALVEIYKGATLKKVFLEPKLILGGFYDILPQKATAMLGGKDK